MDSTKKNGRYERIFKQLEVLLQKPGNNLSRMATVVAILSHKMDDYFWTGFYLLHDGELMVGPYQGPVACQLLRKGEGVCWAAIQRKQPVIVPNVHEFPGHIACDSRSNSEIVIPLMDTSGSVIGVLDVDSKDFNAFNETDQLWLERIVGLISKA